MSPRRTAPGCQITTYHRPNDKVEPTVCGQPLAPGSRWCAYHTRECIRLGGNWRTDAVQ